MKQIVTVIAVLALVASTMTSVYAHCGKCEKGKEAKELSSKRWHAEQMGGCCKDKNTSATVQFGK